MGGGGSRIGTISRGSGVTGARKGSAAAAGAVGAATGNVGRSGHTGTAGAPSTGSGAVFSSALGAGCGTGLTVAGS
jgi:hypothetical protein